MRVKLTVAGIASLPQGNYADVLCPGLNLRIGTKRKTWSVYHRTGGRLRQSKLGYLPAMGLADVRKAAGELVDRVQAGAPPLPPEPHPSALLTVGDLVDRYEAHRRRKGGRGTKTLSQAMRAVRNGLKDYLALPATSFSKTDLRAARDAIAVRAPTLSNRFLAYMSVVLRWAEAEDLIPFAPRIIRVGREVKRDRILSHAEIKAIWLACDNLVGSAEQRSFGRLVKFLLLTGQRRGEAAGLRYGHILDGVWRQRADSNKARREHRLRLPPQALDLLGTGMADQCCFSGVTGRPITGAKTELDRLGGVHGWRLHDLGAPPRPAGRSSASTSSESRAHLTTNCRGSRAYTCGPSSRSPRRRRSNFGRWRSRVSSDRTRREGPSRDHNVGPACKLI